MVNLLEESLTWTNFFVFLFWGIVMLMLVLGFVTYAIYFERKVIGWMQMRIGPNRTGPFGLLQSVADVFKLLIKEDTIPKKAERELFILAPIITFIPSFTIIATIPFSERMFNANLNVGLLFYVALTGISTIGIILGGWASNNKYALLGGMRSAAQMISYEVPLVISVIGVIMMTGSLNLHTIVDHQTGGFWHWNFIPQILGFIIFVIAGVSELNRTPFDLPEAESELVAGYHVEYSGFRFAFFMLSEYVYVFVIASLTSLIFLGGWQ
jgi:NADH-quinone oxidoreductase subunit H